MATERIVIPIDKAGRVVLPKSIRDRMGIRSGMEFEVEETDDSILLKPVQKEVRIIDKDGWLVVQSHTALSEDSIIKTIEKVRNERSKHIAGPG